MNNDELRTHIEELGPWHHRHELREGVFTQSSSQRDQKDLSISIIDPQSRFAALTSKVLPDGLEGRSFLDCACNSGGYCFAAVDAGATEAFGFDIREHWIRQAEFVAANRAKGAEGVRFAQADLMNVDLPRRGFDVTFFNGILYHLASPVGGLKIAADATKELLFMSTAVTASEPDAVEDPGMKLIRENPASLMAGSQTLAWLPSGPKVLESTLAWLGFPEFRILRWIRKRSGYRNPRGRIAIVAAREKGRLADIKDAAPVDEVVDSRAAAARGGPVVISCDA